MTEYQALPPEELKLGSFTHLDWRPSPVERIIYRYEKARPKYLFSTAFLEGNTYTLPEVHSLLDDQVPEGHNPSETNQILNLNAASVWLVEQIGQGKFQADLTTSNKLNYLIAQNEALDAGIPRDKSSVNRDGRGATVSLLGNHLFTGYNKQQLQDSVTPMLQKIANLNNPVTRALNWAAFATYAQIYMDGNKRTARYMMDGILMSHGYDAISIRTTDRNDYNQALHEMYTTGNLAAYASFLAKIGSRSYALDSRPLQPDIVELTPESAYSLDENELDNGIDLM